MYLATAGDFLGWAYLPKVVTPGERLPGRRRHQLGVATWRFAQLPRRYDQGETATHEVGHWLTSSTRSTAGATAGATTSTTRRTRRRRPPAARRQGHVHRTGDGSDPQLHGLLVRPVLHGVHGRPGRTHAGRLADVPRTVGNRSGSGPFARPAPPVSPLGRSRGVTLQSPRPCARRRRRGPPPSPVRDPEVVQGSRQLGRDLVELLGRDPQVAVGSSSPSGGASGLGGRVVLRSA